MIISLFTFATSAGLIFKEKYVHESFWNRNVTPFFEFGDWINQNTDNNSIIMYGLTPQDAWCATNRSIVGDPVFRLSKDGKRGMEIIEFYNVDYLWIDLSNHIYSRNDKIDEVMELYKNIPLNLIKSDTINNYYFYEITK